jgi:hypothetical protein
VGRSSESLALLQSVELQPIGGVLHVFIHGLAGSDHVLLSAEFLFLYIISLGQNKCEKELWPSADRPASSPYIQKRIMRRKETQY